MKVMNLLKENMIFDSCFGYQDYVIPKYMHQKTTLRFQFTKALFM